MHWVQLHQDGDEGVVLPPAEELQVGGGASPVARILPRGEMPLPFVPSKTDIFEVEGGVNVNIVSRT